MTAPESTKGHMHRSPPPLLPSEEKAAGHSAGGDPQFQALGTVEAGLGYRLKFCLKSPRPEDWGGEGRGGEGTGQGRDWRREGTGEVWELGRGGD